MERFNIPRKVTECPKNRGKEFYMNDLLIFALFFVAALVIRRIILSLMASGENAARKARIASNNRSSSIESRESLAERYVKSKQGTDSDEALLMKNDIRDFD